MQTSQYPCLCAGFRKVSRVLTRKYDQYLKPSGLKITQYSMLANIARNPGITVSRLAELLLIDQTTVSRNLQVLEKAGYVNLEAGATDNRFRKIQVSGKGVSKMREAKPLWEIAQLDVEGILGRGGITEILSAFNKITQ